MRDSTGFSSQTLVSGYDEEGPAVDGTVKVINYLQEQGFPQTSFQITNINAGTGADNVIQSDLESRYSTEVTHTQLQEQITALLDKHGLKYSLNWRHAGSPFLTTPGTLVTATSRAIYEVCGYEATLSTGGGTSDGRFIAPTGAQVVEVGPINATIHKVNECVSVEELDTVSILKIC